MANGQNNTPQGQSAQQPVARQPTFFIDDSAKTEPNRPTYWLIQDWLPFRALTLLGGTGGAGKGLVTIWELAAITTKPLQLPGGTSAGPYSVLYFNLEDGKEEINPRLDAAGANRQLVHLVTEWPHKLDANFFDDVRKMIKERTIALIVVDPIVRGLRDSSSAMETADLLTNWQRLALETGVAVLGIVHTNKKGAAALSDNEAVSLLLGSAAIANKARMVWLLVKDRSDEAKKTRILARVKKNITLRNDDHYYRIRYELTQVDGEDYQGNSVKVDTLRVANPERVDGDAEQAIALALRQPKSQTDEGTGSDAKKDIETAILNAVAGNNGPMYRKDAVDAAVAVTGYTEGRVSKVAGELVGQSKLKSVRLRDDANIAALFPNGDPNGAALMLPPTELEQVAASANQAESTSTISTSAT